MSSSKNIQKSHIAKSGFNTEALPPSNVQNYASQWLSMQFLMKWILNWYVVVSTRFPLHGVKFSESTKWLLLTNKTHSEGFVTLPSIKSTSSTLEALLKYLSQPPPSNELKMKRMALRSFLVP
ncbi:hypothetical protein QE152_g38116 [Popillia japonica]|uniref:Uncharacterized protein n=1 Tax=Popillia japonica TaxID=7064 RepID=A0AAW1I8Q7_POPJA